MVGHGRPPTGTRIDIRIPDNLLAEVDRLAEVEGVKRPEMIRRLIADALGSSRSPRS